MFAPPPFFFFSTSSSSEQLKAIQLSNEVHKKGKTTLERGIAAEFHLKLTSRHQQMGQCKQWAPHFTFTSYSCNKWRIHTHHTTQNLQLRNFLQLYANVKNCGCLVGNANSQPFYTHKVGTLTPKTSALTHVCNNCKSSGNFPAFISNGQVLQVLQNEVCMSRPLFSTATCIQLYKPLIIKQKTLKVYINHEHSAVNSHMLLKFITL